MEKLVGNRHLGQTRRLLIVWANATVLWIAFVAFAVRPDITMLLDGVPLPLSVEIATERANPIPDPWFPDSKLYHRFAVRHLKAGSREIAEARHFFPSYGDRPDEELSAHVWALVRERAEAERQIRRSRIVGRLKEAFFFIAPAPPLITFLIGYVIVWKKQAIRSRMARLVKSANDWSPWMKKTVALPILWVVCSGTFIAIFGDQAFYEEKNKALFIALPPVALVLVRLLWRWAIAPTAGSQSDETRD